MYVIVWAFRPKPGREQEFVAAYGPAGRWAAFFRAGPDYLGTELLQPVDSAGEFLTIDRWRTRAAYDAFRAAHRAAYEELDRAGEALTAQEVRLGEFVTDVAADARTSG